MLRLGINGFGRTGRAAARVALERKDIQLVAINSRSDTDSHAYLLKYDSVHGIFPHDIKSEKSYLVVDDRRISCYQYDDPSNIPWRETKVDIVIEATGVFKKRDSAAKHLGEAVKKVIISAPGNDVDKTIVLGVNEKEYNPDKHHVVSNASCTSNCMAVVCKVIDENLGIKRGVGITVHAPTTSQNLLDSSHKKDKRRGRTALLNIIPTTTGFAKAVGLVLPQIAGKLESFALRVPVGDGSIAILNVETAKATDKNSVNQMFERYCTRIPDILKVAKDEMVSQDIIGMSASAIIDTYFTRVIDKNLVSVFAWYDNEMGYSTRLIDLATYIGNQL